MRVRKALAEDIPTAVALARRLALDYPGLECDRLWVAEESGHTIGLVALKSHPDCLELCALGVDPAHRGKGAAKALVKALLAETPGAVHLATIIPAFFEACGFRVADEVPAAFLSKRGTSWCEGCPQELCTVMSKEAVSLPRYPAFKPVALEDQAVFNAFLESESSGVCELSFANIFIWRESERPRWTVLDGSLCVLVEPDSEPPYVLPPIGGDPTPAMIETCLRHAPRLSRVPEALARTFGAAFRLEEDPANFDYIYRVEDLAELKGKRYDGKRNRIRKFETTFAHEYHALTEADVPGCVRLLDDWFEEKRNGGDCVRADKRAIVEALATFDRLGLKGGVVKVGGRVEGFTLGARLNPEMAVISIEIANPGLVGLAQWINREFVRREWTGFRFVNREQDMGIEGLRRAKQSYQPAGLIKKFNLYGKP